MFQVAGNQLFLFGSFILLLVVNLVRWIAQSTKDLTTQTKRSQLLSEIAELRRESEKHNTPSQYAKCAKYQRQANAKEKELASLGSQAEMTLQDKVLMLTSTLKVGLGLIFTMMFWGQSLHVLPHEVAWPFNRMVMVPQVWSSTREGTPVLVVGWLLMCDRATTHLAKALIPTRRPKPAPAASLAAAQQVTQEKDE